MRPCVRTLTPAVLLVAVFLAGGLGGAHAADKRTTLVVGLLSEPPTLNPLVVTTTEVREIVECMFEKLADLQGDLITYRPRLARSWEFSADSLAITFHLRDDARWADGAPVTAQDVRFTWQVEVDTTVAWPSLELKQYIRDVVVVDPHTVRFVFTRRYPYQLMDATDGVILPAHILARVPRDQLASDPFGRAPVGDGPYRLAAWKSGQYIELERNPDYYGPAPHVDHVVFRFVPDMVTLMTQLKKGEIDLLESIPADQQRALVQGYPRVRLYRYPSRRIDFISWNLQHKLFADADVRRALTMAINRQEIIRAVWAGNATECTSPIPPVVWAYDDSIAPIPFDPERAARILAAKGWKDTDGDGVLDRDGHPFSFEIVTNHSNQQRVDICTMVAAELGRIGVHVDIRTFEFSTFISRVLAMNYDACVLESKTETKPDLTTAWHSHSIRPHGYNICGYSNPEVDALIERARECLDANEARGLWGRAQRIIYHDQPYTFLAVPDEVNALDRRFCNVEPNAVSFFANLREWRVAPDCGE